jgi:hypothetical protein
MRRDRVHLYVVKVVCRNAQDDKKRDDRSIRPAVAAASMRVKSGEVLVY